MRLPEPLSYSNQLAHAFRFTVLAEGSDAPADLTGVGCSGQFVRHGNNTTVSPLTGTVTGNVCEIILEPSCYVVPGRYTFTMDISQTVPTDGVAAFSTTTNYAIGDKCVYNSNVWVFTAAHSAGAWTGSDATIVYENRTILWIEGVVEKNISGTIIDPGTPVGNITQAINSANAAASSATSAASAATSAAATASGAVGYIAYTESMTTASRAYAVGDYLTYNGNLYEVTTAIASGGSIVTSGSGQNVTTVTGGLGAECSSLKNSVSATTRNLWTIGDIGTFTKNSEKVYLDTPLTQGETYTLSADVTSSDTDDDDSRIYLLFSNGNSLSSPSILINRGLHQSVTFEVPVRTDVEYSINGFIFYAGRTATKSEGDTASFTNIQLEQVSEATAYIPHITATDYVCRETASIINGQGKTISLNPGEFAQGKLNESGGYSASNSSPRITTPNFLNVTGIDKIYYSVQSGYRFILSTYSTASESAAVDVYVWLTGSGCVKVTGNYIRVCYAAIGDDPALTTSDTSVVALSYKNPFWEEMAVFPAIYEKTKWLALGDSITAGVYSNGTNSEVNSKNGWVSRLANSLGYDLKNMGVRGMGYLATGSNQITWADTLDAVDDLTDSYNLITVALGINDYIDENVSLSDIGTAVTTGIDRLMTKFPTARLVFITPFNSNRVGNASDNYAYGTDKGGRSLKDVADKIQEICTANGVECIYASNGFLFNNYNIATLLPDKTHPSDYCHTLIAKNMAHYLLN